MPLVNPFRKQAQPTDAYSISSGNSDDNEEHLQEPILEAAGYKKNANGDTILPSGLKAGLQNRMINLIALCGLIGPGVFIGTGQDLAAAGPAGMIAGFAIVGILVLSMMNSIGELNAYLDVNFSVLGSRFVSPGFGATLALYYCIIWVCNEIAEYTSLTSSLETYSDKIPTYGWFLIFWGIFTLFQMLNVAWWGACEYVLGFVKLAFLGGFYVFAIVYAGGGIKGASPGNLFKDKPLNDGFTGIANSFVYAGVFYSGIEGVSFIAAEARNPRKAIPIAVRSTIFRVIYVYFGLSIFYGITVPYDDPMLTNPDRVMRSPMTIAFTHAGWAGSRYFVTTMIWITCFSSINTAIYFASRSLYSMSKMGYAPKVFSKTTKRGVPWVSIHFIHLWSFLSILSFSEGSAVAYNYIVNVAGVACFIVWTAIAIIHIRFRKALRVQGIQKSILPYQAYFYPWSNYVAIILGLLLTLVQGWSDFAPFDYHTFIDGYIMLPLFPIIWFCYDKFYLKHTGFVALDEIDLLSGRRPDLDMNNDDLATLQTINLQSLNESIKDTPRSTPL